MAYLQRQREKVFSAEKVLMCLLYKGDCGSEIAFSYSIRKYGKDIPVKENWNYYRGDIYLADLGTNVGSEQSGCRPVLVLQNDVGNHFAPTLIVAPITSRCRKKAGQPTHYVIEDVRNLDNPSVVLAEQLITIDKSRILKYLGKAADWQMREIERAVKISLGLLPPISQA